MFFDDDYEPELTGLNKAMKDIFISKDNADITFIIHGKELPAHKLIVTTRSPVFKAMIEGPMAPSDQRHSIDDPDITFEDFEKFIQFLYTDQLEMRKSDVIAMLHLGNFYDVPYFLQKCVDYIHTTFIHPDNALEFAEIGFFHAPTTSLLKICLIAFNTYIIQYDAQFAYDDGSAKWIFISPELMVEIVKQQLQAQDPPIFAITGDKMFQKVFQWAENVCINRGEECTIKNIQEMMAPLMPYFNYRQLLPSTLTTIVKKFKLIPDDELNDYFVGHISKMIKSHSHLNVPLSENIVPRRRYFEGERGGHNHRQFSPENYAPRGGMRRRNFDIRFASNPVYPGHEDILE